MPENPIYSVLIAAYNEEGNVIHLHKEIVEVMKEIGKPFEIIFVNDGSTDKTLTELKTLKPVKIINFRKNRGQTAAWDAGFKNAKGKYKIVMDGDGQNDPADIPKLIEELNKGYDFVSGWRHNRKDKKSTHILSRFGNILRKKLIGDKIHDSGCSLKIYKKECLENLELHGEMHRYIHALLTWKGFKVSEVKVNHRARTIGTTKYNWKKNIKGLVDLIYVWFTQKYSNRPLHLFGSAGVLSCIIAILIGIYLVYLKFFTYASLSDTALPIVALGLFLFGVTLFVSGIIIDLLIKIKLRVNDENMYLIKEIIENE